MTGTLWAGVRVILERAIERGELTAMSDVELLSMLPLSLMQNWRAEHERGPDAALVERIVAQFYSPAQTGARRESTPPTEAEQHALEDNHTSPEREPEA